MNGKCLTITIIISINIKGGVQADSKLIYYYHKRLTNKGV